MKLKNLGFYRRNLATYGQGFDSERPRWVQRGLWEEDLGMCRQQIPLNMPIFLFLEPNCLSMRTLNLKIVLAKPRK